MDRQYTKVLVARYRPENKCYVAEGEILFVKPRRQVPLKEHVNNKFLGTRDPGTTSQFGWVKEEVKGFTLEQFMETNLESLVIEGDQRDHLRIMLDSIAKLPQDTPVAAGYARRGFEDRRMEFEVYRVFFYK